MPISGCCESCCECACDDDCKCDCRICECHKKEDLVEDDNYRTVADDLETIRDGGE